LSSDASTRPELSYHPLHKAWDGRFPWTGRKLYVLIGGDTAGPNPALAATAWRIVDDFGEVVRAIEAFAIGLVPDGRVRFDRRPDEGFRARICGFYPGNFYYSGVRVEDPERPSVAVVEFVTGEPDGYVAYIAMLDDGRPTEIIAEV
jgi:hypothetical protein